MKQQVFMPMGKDELKKLTAEVKETVSANVTGKKDRPFTIVDLWNVERQSRLRRKTYA
jgi:hypothetical protein